MMEEIQNADKCVEQPFAQYDLHAMVNELVEARDAITEAETELKQLEEDYPDITQRFVDMSAAVSDAKKIARIYEGRLRTATNDTLKAGEPIPAEIKTKPESVCFYDEDDALRWCVEHSLLSLVTLNTKNFEDILLKTPLVFGVVSTGYDGSGKTPRTSVRLYNNSYATVDKRTVASIPRKLNRHGDTST